MTDKERNIYESALKKRGPARIDIHCKGCGTIHNVPRTDEIKPNVDHLCCNWCPECQDQAQDYYHEWPVCLRKPKGSVSKIEQQRINYRFQ